MKIEIFQKSVCEKIPVCLLFSSYTTFRAHTGFQNNEFNPKV